MPKRSHGSLDAKTETKRSKINKIKKSEVSFEDLETFSNSDESFGSNGQSSSSSIEIENSSDTDESDITSNNSKPVIGHTWRKIKRHEQAKDIKSKFTVSKTGPCKIDNCKNPIDFLDLFLSESVFMMMVHHSNAYAKHKILKDKLSKRSRLNNWRDITIGEMKKFVSILINMGITHRPSLSDYWNSKPSQFIPFYSKALSLHRFETIHSVFHLSSDLSSTKDGSAHESCKNARELLTALNDSFKHYFVPGQEISVSEGLIGSKKHHTYVQYVPAKKDVYHNIKKIDLCDSSSGYVFHSSLIKYRDRRAAGLLAKRVVIEVLNEAQLTGKGYHIFTDSSYTSFGLSRELLAARTFLTGIMGKKASELKSNTINPKPEAGNTMYLRKGDHLVMEHKRINNKSLNMITTGYYAEDTLITSKKGKEKTIPLPVYMYNKHKVSMDRKNKSFLITSSRMTRITWRKIVHNLIDMAILNAFILYQANTSKDKQVSRLQFILDIVEKLALQENSIRSLVFANIHRPLLLPKLERRVCEVCRMPNSRHFCPSCNVGIHPECFQNLNHQFGESH